MTTTSIRKTTRELDNRENCGLQVRLLWNELEDPPVWVHVQDWHNCSSLCVNVPKGVHPLEVFHHPFAYARTERVER